MVIIGAVGSRIDHSLSNIHMLKKLLDNGVKGIILNENNEVSLIRDHILLQREENVKISLLPLTQKVCGVTTKGLLYPLKDATLELGKSIGISNEFSCSVAEITTSSGLLLVIKEWN